MKIKVKTQIYLNAQECLKPNEQIDITQEQYSLLIDSGLVGLIEVVEQNVEPFVEPLAVKKARKVSMKE